MSALLNRFIRAGLILGAFALAAAGLAGFRHSGASIATLAEAAAPQIRVQVNLVNLFATVRDKKTKGIVGNMNQDDFKVSEDNVEQKITSFSRETTLPITLALMIDTSGSEEGALGAEQEAAIRFLSRVMRKGDLSMVLSFDSDADMLADFTDDRNVLERAIRRTRIAGASMQGATGATPPGTVFYDAVYLACNDKLVQEAGRKAVVVLTDAEDNGSRVKLQEAVEAAQRTDTVVHVLLVSAGSTNERAARELSDETGGRTIVVRSEKNLEQAFDQLSEELRSQYTLGYTSSNTAHDGSFRKVKVDSTRKDVDVLTRRGYYAPKN